MSKYYGLQGGGRGDQFDRVSQSFLLPVNVKWEYKISCDNALLLGRNHEYFFGLEIELKLTWSFYSKL